MKINDAYLVDQLFWQALHETKCLAQLGGYEKIPPSVWELARQRLRMTCNLVTSWHPLSKNKADGPAREAIIAQAMDLLDAYYFPVTTDPRIVRVVRGFLAGLAQERLSSLILRILTSEPSMN